MEDAKPFLRALVAGMAVFFIWMWISPRLFPQPERPARQGSQPVAATRPATSAPASVASTASSPVQPDGISVVGADGAQLVTLGQAEENGDFRMEVVCSNRGASIERLALSDFAQELRSEQRYEILLPITDPVTGATYNSLAIERIKFVEQQREVDLANVLWAHRRHSDQQGEEVVFEAVIQENGEDILKVTRRYRLEKQPVKDLKKNDLDRLRHDFAVSTTVQNLSSRPQDVVVTARGPIGLRREDPRGERRLALAANGPFEEPDFKSEYRAAVSKEDGFSIELASPEPGNPFLYATLTNKFFTTILYPVLDPETKAQMPNGLLQKVEAVDLLGNQPLDGSDAHNRADLTLRFTTRPMPLAPGAAITSRYDCYFGPKSKTAFQRLSPYKERNYYQMVEHEYYWCAWAPLTNLMIWFFQWIHSIPPHNYGIAIIVLVFIVRLLLHPITKHQQKNMMKMQQNMAKLQPKLEEAKQKYANDKAKLNEAIMAVYRDEGVSPAGQFLTCLPMALQMPVWGALWTALSFTVEMRHQGFVFWIKDLTAPDALFQFGTTVTIPLLGPTSSFNLLPILLGISMYLQQKLMPKPHKVERAKRQTSDQMQQQKIMMYMMTAMMTLIFYNAPSGLTLYIMASTAAGLVEQWRIRKHLQAEEEAGPKQKGAPEQQKTTRLRKPGFLKKLEKLADQAREQQQQASEPKPKPKPKSKPGRKKPRTAGKRVRSPS